MIDDYISLEIISNFLPVFLSGGIVAGFLIATLLIFLTYGIFKAISFLQF